MEESNSNVLEYSYGNNVTKNNCYSATNPNYIVNANFDSVDYFPENGDYTNNAACDRMRHTYDRQSSRTEPTPAYSGQHFQQYNCMPQRQHSIEQGIGGNCGFQQQGFPAEAYNDSNIVRSSKKVSGGIYSESEHLNINPQFYQQVEALTNSHTQEENTSLDGSTKSTQDLSEQRRVDSSITHRIDGSITHRIDSSIRHRIDGSIRRRKKCDGSDASDWTEPDAVVKAEPTSDEDARCQSPPPSQSSDCNDLRASNRSQRQFIAGVVSPWEKPIAGVSMWTQSERETGDTSGLKVKEERIQNNDAEAEFNNLPLFWDSKPELPDLAESLTLRCTRDIEKKLQNRKESQESMEDEVKDRKTSHKRQAKAKSQKRSLKKRNVSYDEKKMKRSEYMRNKRANLSEEEKASYRAREAERKRTRRSQLSDERRQEERQKWAERARVRRANLSEREKFFERQKKAQEMRERRALMSAEEKFEERLRQMGARTRSVSENEEHFDCSMDRIVFDNRLSLSDCKNSSPDASFLTDDKLVDRVIASVAEENILNDTPRGDGEAEGVDANKIMKADKMQIWHVILSGPDKARLNAARVEEMRLRRALITEEDRQRYKERERDRMRRYRAALSEQVKAKIRAAKAAEMRLRRAMMSEEEQLKQRELARERARRRRAMLSLEDRAAEQAKNTKEKRRRRAEHKGLGMRYSRKREGQSDHINDDREPVYPCFSCHRFLHKKLVMTFRRDKYNSASPSMIDSIGDCFVKMTGMETKYICKTCNDSLIKNLMPRMSPAFPFASALAAEKLLNDCNQSASGKDCMQLPDGGGGPPSMVPQERELRTSPTEMIEQEHVIETFTSTPKIDNKSNVSLVFEVSTSDGGDTDVVEDDNPTRPKNSHPDRTRKFACQHCGDKFLNSKSLAAHMFLHTGVMQNCRQFVCRVCGEECGDGVTYSDHIQANHRELCNALCEICGRCFFHSHSLTMHMKRHTNVKSYCCDLCGSSYKFASQLSNHQRSHRNEKPYTCSVCMKSFSHTNSLSLHMRVHTNDRPYACKTCNKTFKYYAQMSKHNHHNHNPNKPAKKQCEGMQVEIEEPVEVEDDPVTLPNGIKPSKKTRYSRLANKPGIILVETFLDDDGISAQREATLEAKTRKSRSDKGKKRGKNKVLHQSGDPFEPLARQYIKAYTSQKENELDCRWMGEGKPYEADGQNAAETRPEITENQGEVKRDGEKSIQEDAGSIFRPDTEVGPDQHPALESDSRRFSSGCSIRPCYRLDNDVDVHPLRQGSESYGKNIAGRRTESAFATGYNREENHHRMDMRGDTRCEYQDDGRGSNNGETRSDQRNEYRSSSRSEFICGTRREFKNDSKSEFINASEFRNDSRSEFLSDTRSEFRNESRTEFPSDLRGELRCNSRPDLLLDDRGLVRVDSSNQLPQETHPYNSLSGKATESYMRNIVGTQYDSCMDVSRTNFCQEADFYLRHEMWNRLHSQMGGSSGSHRISRPEASFELQREMAGIDIFHRQPPGSPSARAGTGSSECHSSPFDLTMDTMSRLQTDLGIGFPGQQRIFDGGRSHWMNWRYMYEAGLGTRPEVVPEGDNLSRQACDAWKMQH